MLTAKFLWALYFLLTSRWKFIELCNATKTGLEIARYNYYEEYMQPEIHHINICIWMAPVLPHVPSQPLVPHAL